MVDPGTTHDRGFGNTFYADPRHGPLPAVLLWLTFTTGMIDAVSMIGLGRVFVANMTGNVVFLALHLGGAHEYSLVGALLALGGFLVGAGCGGWLSRRREGHRGLVLRDALAVHVLCLAAALAVQELTPWDRTTTAHVVIALLATPLGLQNAVVRSFAVPDLPTTVLTMAVTGLGADRPRAGAPARRRMSSVLLMFCGALVGVLLIRGPGLSTVLVALLLGQLVMLALSARLAVGVAGWHRLPG